MLSGIFAFEVQNKKAEAFERIASAFCLFIVTA